MWHSQLLSRMAVQNEDKWLKGRAAWRSCHLWNNRKSFPPTAICRVLGCEPTESMCFAKTRNLWSAAKQLRTKRTSGAKCNWELTGQSPSRSQHDISLQLKNANFKSLRQGCLCGHCGIVPCLWVARGRYPNLSTCSQAFSDGRWILPAWHGQKVKCFFNQCTELVKYLDTPGCNCRCDILVFQQDLLRKSELLLTEPC